MKSKNIIFVLLFFFIIWGLKGLVDGHGFFGGILSQFVAAYKILKLVGAAVVIFFVIKLVIHLSNSN